MKKTALFFAFVLLVTYSLIACKDKKQKENNMNGSSNEIIVAENGNCDFKIVYPDRFTDGQKTSALYIKEVMSDCSGAKIDISTDWIKDGDSPDPNAKEILVGNTNRDESQSLGDRDFAVSVIGNKIVINGKDDNSLYYAVGAFVSRYVKTDENSRIALPNDLSFSENVQGADGWKLYSLPVMEGVSFGEHSKSVTNTFGPSGTGIKPEYATLQYFSDVQKDEFDAYVEKLESYGYVVDSKSSSKDRQVVSLYRAVVGRQYRFCLTYSEKQTSLTVSQIVPYNAE